MRIDHGDVRTLDGGLSDDLECQHLGNARQQRDLTDDGFEPHMDQALWNGTR